jgi:hypothetical protein
MKTNQAIAVQEARICEAEPAKCIIFVRVDTSVVQAQVRLELLQHMLQHPTHRSACTYSGDFFFDPFKLHGACEGWQRALGILS